MGKYWNRHFTRKDREMAKKHMKRCSKTIVISGMEIKTTVKYPTGIATSQKTERLSIGKVGEQVQLSYTSRGKRK